jgi:transcription termination factor Rho
VDRAEFRQRRIGQSHDVARRRHVGRDRERAPASSRYLVRGLVERRIVPAINIDRSGTRKEELIYHPEELQRIFGLRRAMQGLGPIESMEMLITRLKKTKSNAEFLLSLSRQ